ncbi:hypothetical protein [Roseibium sp. MB-4]
MATIISNEDDLFELIEQIEIGVEVDATEVKFDGWPKYEVIVRGEDFDGGVPTRIMPALLSLQKAIDEAYARSVYGEQKRLTKEERKKTELVVHLEKGSTKFEAELWKAFNNVLDTAVKSMDGTQTLTAILGVAAIAGAGWYLKIFLNNRSKEKEIEFDAKVSEQETERYRIIADLAKRNQQLAGSKAALEESNEKLIRKLEDQDQLVLNEGTAVSGHEGKTLVRRVPDAPIEVRMDGLYRILSVQSGAIKNGFKAVIENIETNDRITIDIPEGTLGDDQLRSLQQGEWEKTTVQMQINASKRGDKLLKATLTHAGLSDA